MTLNPGGRSRWIREQKPLVHQITNYVMNETANATLALGALPVMAHAREEVEEMVGLASALVINIGTLSPAWVEAMLLAGKRANELEIPVVVDPVGAGATTYRTETARRLLDEVDVTVLRGNAGEIATLVGVEAEVRGVESIAAGGDRPSCARRARAGSRRLGDRPDRPRLRRRRGGSRLEWTRAARHGQRHGLHVDCDHGLLPRAKPDAPSKRPRKPWPPSASRARTRRRKPEARHLPRRALRRALQPRPGHAGRGSSLWL